MNRSKVFENRATRILAFLAIALFLGGCGDKGAGLDQLLAEARQERENGNYSAAIIHLKNALQKNPEHAEAHFLLGVTYSDSGNLPFAETDLGKALELGYDQTKVIPALGRALLKKGEFQKVLDKVRLEGETGSQVQAEILTLHAMASFGLNRRVEARQLLEQALAKQPEYADALLALARLEAGDKKLDEAARLIERALASAPKSADAWLLSGDFRRMRGDRPGATEAYQKVIDLYPKNVAARLSIASLQIEAGSFDEAAKHISEVRKIAPNNPLTSYMQALIEFRKQNFPAARAMVLEVLKVAPNYMPSVLLAGAIEAALGSHNQAQTYLGQVVAQAPDNLYARKLLISSLSKSGRIPRAIEVLQPALQQAPEDGALMGLAGEVYMQSNDFAKAAQYFDKAAKLEPKSAGAHLGLGLSRLAAGETDRAVAELESAVQLDSGKYQADLVLVTYHLKRENYDQALKALGTLEKKQPDNPLTYNLKAAIYSGKKDFAAARKNLERALELQPTYVPAAVNLAQIDLREKNSKAARGRLEAILEKDKNNVQALLALANLAPQLGATPKEAIGWLERAASASPDAVQVQLLLARAYAQTDEVKRALELAQRIQGSNPENADSLDTLGSIQLAAGQKDQALATFGKLVQVQPKSPFALYRLANAQAVAAKGEAAISTLKKALSLKPDYQEAQVALAELEIRAGRYPAAMQIAQQLKKQAAKSPLGSVIEGDALMAEKKFALAIKSYEAGFALGKSNTILIKLHRANVLAGKPAEAKARLAQWLKESPEDAGVRLYAADSSLNSGEYKDAIEQLEWLLRKQPDNIIALNNLAWAYHQAKDPRASETAERAYKLKPDNADVTDTLGWILSEQGNLSRGIELLQKAVASAPGAPVIRFHLAQALVKSGDKAKARAELERIEAAGTKFPQEAEAMSLLKQLRN